MNAPKWIKADLKKRGMAYRECRHPCAYTAQEVAMHEHVSGHNVAKVVMVIADEKPIELVLPASRMVQLDRVSRLLGATGVRLASEEEMGKLFPDCEVGAAPPMRCGKGVPILMDSAMAFPGDILFQAGTHRDSIRMAFDDWFDMAHPRVGEFTRPAELPPRDAFIRADPNDRAAELVQRL